MTITRIGPTSTPSTVRVPTSNSAAGSKPSSPGFPAGRTSASRTSRRPLSSANQYRIKSDSDGTDTESTSSGDASGLEQESEEESGGQGEDEGYFARKARKKVKRGRFREEDGASALPPVAGTGVSRVPASTSPAGRSASAQSPAVNELERRRSPTPPIDYLALATADRRRSSFAPVTTPAAFDLLLSARRGSGALASQGKVGFVGKGISVTDIKSVLPSVIPETDGSSSATSIEEESARRMSSSVRLLDPSAIRRDPTDMGTQLAIEAGITAHGDMIGRGKHAFSAYSRGHGKTMSASQSNSDRPQLQAVPSSYFSSIPQPQPEQLPRKDLDATPVARTDLLSSPSSNVTSDGDTVTGERSTITSSPIASFSYFDTSPVQIPPFNPSTSRSAETEIPPPCSPRKHRSAILLSRVRAQTGGNPLAEVSPGLTDKDNGLAAGGQADRERSGSHALGLNIESGGEHGRTEQDDWQEVDRSTALDNAARFYHRHPYAKSASTSPDKRFGSLNFTADRTRAPVHLRRSPSGHLGDNEQDDSGTSPPAGFATVGGLIARRNFTLPFPTDRNDADSRRDAYDAHAVSQAACVSGASHLVPDINANGRLVILTPTTQEWRELGLDHLKHLGGEGVASESDSEKGKDWDRRDSEASSSASSLDNVHVSGPDSRGASPAGGDKSGSEPTSRRSSTISPLITGALNRRRQESADKAVVTTELRNRTRSDTVHSVDNLVTEDTCAERTALSTIPASSQDLLIQIPSRSSGTTSLVDVRTLDDSQTGIGFSDGRMAPSLRSAPPLLEETDVFARLLSEQMAQRQRQSSSPSATGSPGHRTSPRATASRGAHENFEDRLGNEDKSTSEMLATRTSKDFEPAFSLSRSQSMREPPSAAPHMTKREKERERLFRMVGEEIERSGFSEGQGGARGIKQIGKGLSLGMPSSNPGMANSIIRTESGPAAFGPTQAPSQIAKSTDSLAVPTVLSPTPHRLQEVPHLGHSPLVSEVLINTVPSPVKEDKKTEVPSSAKPRSRAHSRAPSLAQLSTSPITRSEVASDTEPGATASTPLPPLTSRRRQSQRLSLLAGRTPLPHQFPAVLPPSAPTGHNGPRKPSAGLSAFSAFATMTPSSPPVRRPPLGKDASGLAAGSLSAIPGHLQQIGRSKSTLSLAPSTVAPSECGTPVGETAGGLGGGGIDDYVIQSEAGKGAYGLVRRAKRKGPDGQPIGEEVIIKYIIKSRILADCWKKHKVLGPIPIEIHVMEQLRNVSYRRPKAPHPWDPLRAGHPDYGVQANGEISLETGQDTPTNGQGASQASVKSVSRQGGLESGTGVSGKSDLQDLSAWQAKLSNDNLKDRGHPNIVKMLDFFEDREFYYLVMPRFGIGLDLFDRIESAPEGLEPFDIRSLLGQLSDAVAFLHTNGIVHRDIKDENVILDGGGHCQLIDFGSAAHWRPGRKWDTFSGTLDYASPEILRGEMYSGKEQDVWALGVVGFVMICGETPFLSAEEAAVGLSEGSKARSDLLARCGGDRGEEGCEADGGGRMADALDFVERCLELQVDQRPPAEALMEHRFVFGKDGWTGFRGWLETDAK